MDPLIDTSILDLSPVIVLKPNGSIEKWNQGLSRIYGWSQREAIGKNAHQLLRTVFPQPLDEIEHQIFEKGEWQGELIHTCKDGSKINVASQWILEKNKKVKNLAILEFIEDITDRKRTEEALHAAQKWTESILESVADTHIIFDRNWRYRYLNKAAVQGIGRPPEQIIGRTLWELYPDIAGTELERQYRRAMEEHTPVTFDFHYPAADTWWQNRFYPMPEGLAVFATNITDYKRTEKGLRESREHLAHLSRRLVETQEQERRRIARELHDEIGQTLTALMITLNGIQRAALDPALMEKFTNLQNLAHELIDQVNSLSSDLRPKVLDDLGLIPGLISMINRLTIQTGIQIDFKHGPLERRQIPPEIEITAYRIIQEALTNVIRHAEAKLAIVRIQIDENALWIQVQDEGKGFDYSTALNSASSMGLMNMLERAELVGGLVSIQTAPGEGTNITCHLPLAAGFVERRKNARN